MRREDVPLSGRLEKEPLQLLRLLLEVRGGDLALGIIFLNEIGDDRVRLPTIK